MRRRSTLRTLPAALLLAVTVTACGSDAGDNTEMVVVADTVADTTADTVADTTDTTTASGTVTSADVTRDDGGDLTVRWTGSGVVTVRVGSDGTTFPDVVGEVDTAADGNGELALDAGADSVRNNRVYVRVEAFDGTALTAAERRVPMEGAHNFRDLGGYETVDGRHVRWGQVFRSGELADMTDGDVEMARALGIKLVCDLRSDAEVEEAPDPDIGAERLRLSVNDDSVDVQAIKDAVLAGDLDGISPDLLLDGMPRIALEFDDLWSNMLRRLADPANRPTNVHCSAGKDRAGWASALVLRALGVPEETVMQDYLLSNEYLADDHAATLAEVRTIVAAIKGVPEDEVDLSNLEALLDVRPEYLQAAFDAVDDTYGSFEAYLTDGLGLTQSEIDALRESLLE